MRIRTRNSEYRVDFMDDDSTVIVTKVKAFREPESYRTAVGVQYKGYCISFKERKMFLYDKEEELLLVTSKIVQISNK